MARKGVQKVKTGCITCKLRKVKCDEGKPDCARCTSTGRRCDGYPPRQQGAFSWDELLGKRPIIPAITSRHTTQEGRALEYFRCVVAPAFSGWSEDCFWTRLVAQASSMEPAVRHAVVAISSIYEQIGDAVLPGDFLDSPNGRFAIGHYNQALKQLTKTPDESVVLFVCVLFVCVEILQDNKDAAIAHCRHGVSIFNNVKDSGSAWTRDHLLPMFVRLSVFPFFFGGTLENFPGLDGLDWNNSAPHASLDDSRFRLDLLVSRGVRFIRASDTYKRDTPSDPQISETMREEQNRLGLWLDRWFEDFTYFTSTNIPESEAMSICLLLQMKYLVSKIWIAVCMDDTEMGYDQHLSSFQQIKDLAELAVASEHTSSSQPAKRLPSRSKFMFEMGYMPLLYFVIIKCRHLETRLAALRHLASLSAHRENFWDSVHSFSIGWSVIEREHGIEFDTL
ncbi:hypothetical protein B0T17DRAFT_467841, partial [Bombardia bombarda]